MWLPPEIAELMDALRREVEASRAESAAALAETAAALVDNKALRAENAELRCRLGGGKGFGKWPEPNYISKFLKANHHVLRKRDPVAYYSVSGRHTVFRVSSQSQT